MAENIFLPYLPISSMFEGEEKVMTAEWQEFFRNLFDRVGGIDESSNDELERSLISQLYSTPINYSKRIDELEKKLNSLPSSHSFGKDIAELRKLIELFPTIPKILGPQSSTDNAVARWNETNGHRLQNSGVTIDDNDNITVPSLTASQLVKTDASKVLTSTVGTVQVPIVMDMYDAEPARASETNWHGGMLSLATAQPLDSVPTDIVVSKGIGKLIVVINAGGDVTGEITVTGESIDRETGASTPADTDTLTVDALTTDNSTTDSNGNVIHGFVGAYITSKWFTGTVTLSTTNLTLTDVDVWHVSFEQANDSSDLVLNTFDVNLYTTGVAAEFDAYLQTIHVTGDKCEIHNEGALHIGADGETALVNKYWRLRKGNIDDPIDGLTDGFWVDIHYSNTPSQIEDVTASVWLTRTITVELS